MVRKNRLGWLITFALEYIFIFILSWLTPLYADDLLETHLSLPKIFQVTWNDYNGTNGRFIGQFIYRILDNLPAVLFAILNAAVFCLFTWLIFKIATRNHYNLFKYIILLACLWITIPAFGQTILWKAGAGNYLWMTTIILLYLLGNFSEELCGSSLFKHWLVYLMPILSFIAGWGNENTSFAAIILSVFIIFYQHLVQKQPFKKMQIINVVFLIIGYLILILAPANHNRSASVPTIFNSSNDTYLSKLFIACLNVILTLPKFYFVLILFIAIMALVMKKYYFSSLKAAYALFFIVAGGLSIIALIVGPMYTWDGGRAYFGGIIFLVIALFTLLPDNLQAFMGQSVIRYAMSLTVITLLFIVSFGFAGWGIYDWYQSSQAIKQRYEYVQNQVIKGHKSVHVPNFSYLPQTKYSVNNGLADISSDYNFWINKGYYNYFPGLKKITP
ncbi:MAG: hypothetical protein J6584_05640 [Lactobacillus sp.]|uniref:DUF3329 domain-containing protein n=1 Tax=Bombilactobacillus bombi TaxID=1303590 RepID=UPI0035E96480|nr:hypothetical protein [Lactobacillus sp.]